MRKILLFAVLGLVLAAIAFANQGSWPAPGPGGTFASSSSSSSSSSGGPPTFVDYAQGNADTSSGTVATASVSIPANGLAAVFVAGSQSVSSVACGGSSLSLARRMTLSDPYYFEAWYASGLGSATTTCTATFSSSASYRAIFVATYSGIATSSALDQTSCNSTNGLYTGASSCSAVAVDTATTMTAGATATTTNANDLLVLGGLQWNRTATFTQASPYTIRSESNPSMYSLFDTTVSATGAYPNANAATFTPGDAYASIFLAFKAAP